MLEIIGPDGRPISSNNKPDYSQVAVVSVRDRWSTYPSNGLTPGKLARIFREAEEGDIYRQMELFEEMERKDAHLFAELQKRKQAVLGLDWEIIPYSSSPADKKAAQLVQDAMEFEGLEAALLDVLDALGKGFSVTEIMWMLKSDQVMVNSLKWVVPKRIIFDDINPEEFRLITDDAPIRGIPLPENKFIVHTYKAVSGHPSTAGLIRICAWMYLFKNYSVKDWVTFAEVYGMPIRLGKYDAAATPDDREALTQAVIQLGTDAAGIISKNTEIEFVSAIKDAKNIHEALAEFCNKEVSKAILGQTLTADVGDRGSYAASQTHNEVRRDLTKADAKALAETLRRCLFRPLVRFNYGDGPNLPWMKYDLSEPEDEEKIAKVYSMLIKDVGLPVSKKHVYEKFGVPEPEEGEEVLSPPSPYPGMQTPLKMVLKSDSPAAINHQAEVDALADRARDMAGEAMQSLLAPVRELLQSGASLEEIRDRLPELLHNIDTSDMEEIISRSLFVADLYGRWVADVGGT